MVTVQLAFEKWQICLVAKSNVDLVINYETVKWVLARSDGLVVITHIGHVSNFV